MATALVHGNAKTEQMVTFGPDEQPRSLQLYGSDPEMMGRGRRPSCATRGLVDHVDLNFGCPAAKVTRQGGGAAVPAKPALLRAIVRAAVTAADAVRRPGHRQVPHGPRTTTCSPTCAPAPVCEDEGVAYIALHARTAEQHYAGDARWDAIGELKAHVTTIPVLGNGDIWVAADAVAMMRRHRLRRRRRRPRLPRPAVAVRRPARRVRRPARPAAAAARRRRRRDGRPRPRPRRPPRLRAHGDARLPQAHGVVPHRLPGRARGPPPAGDGVVARRARRPARRARPRARPSSPAASGSAAATPTARSASPCPTASSTTSSPCPTTPTCSPSPAAEPA